MLRLWWFFTKQKMSNDKGHRMSNVRNNHNPKNALEQAISDLEKKRSTSREDVVAMLTGKQKKSASIIPKSSRKNRKVKVTEDPVVEDTIEPIEEIKPLEHIEEIPDIEELPNELPDGSKHIGDGVFELPDGRQVKRIEDEK